MELIVLQVPVLQSTTVDHEESVACFSPLAADYTLGDTTILPSDRSAPPTSPIILPTDNSTSSYDKHSEGRAGSRSIRPSGAEILSCPQNVRPKPSNSNHRTGQLDTSSFPTKDCNSTQHLDKDKNIYPTSTHGATGTHESEVFNLPLVENPKFGAVEESKRSEERPNYTSRTLLGTAALNRGATKSYDLNGRPVRTSNEDNTSVESHDHKNNANADSHSYRTTNRETVLRNATASNNLINGRAEPPKISDSRVKHRGKENVEHHVEEKNYLQKMTAKTSPEERGASHDGSASVLQELFEVYPKQLSIEPDSTAAVVVINKTRLRLNLQTSSSASCLQVDPPMNSVGPQGSVSLQLGNNQRLTAPVAVILTVKCNNYESQVNVTCLAAAPPPSVSAPEKPCISGLQVSHYNCPRRY